MEMVETARADEETGGHCGGSCLCGAMGLDISSNHLLNANDDS